MTNKNYVSGRRKEYRIKKKLEKEGWIVIRSAGSHSFADLIAIMRAKPFETMKVRFIQVKPKKMSQNALNRLQEAFKYLNQVAICSFEVIK